MEDFDNNCIFFWLWGWNDSRIIPYKSLHFPQNFYRNNTEEYISSEIFLDQHAGKNYNSEKMT